VPDDRLLAEFKLTQARAYQQYFASDKFWEQIALLHRAYAELLTMRQKFQRLARRCKNDPVRFCESLQGKEWFNPPRNATRRQLHIVSQLNLGDLLTHPENIQSMDPGALLKSLQGLTARPPGRKRKSIFAEALKLRKMNPPTSYHKICLHLNTAYAGMSAHQRRAERERVRSGVTRLQRR